MTVVRTGWEHHELVKEMNDLSVAGLLDVYKREKAALYNLCLEFIKIPDGEYKNQFKDRCILQQEAVEKVALEIADALTTNKK